MHSRRTCWLAVALAAGWSLTLAAQTASPDRFAVRLRQAQAALAALLPERVDGVFETLARHVDPTEAMALVEFMDQYWRLAGNDGFDASQDRIRDRLSAAGYVARAARGAGDGRPGTWFEQYENGGKGWSHTVGTLTLLGDGAAGDEVLLSRDRHRVALCINSFSTVAGGVTAPVVDVGRGTEQADYDGKVVTGAVVLGDGDVGALYREATSRGAIGVVSTSLGSYVNPDPADWTGSPTPRHEWDILQWGAIPYDDARRGFGFKATPRAAHRLRQRLASAPARVRVDVAASFTARPSRTLVAEIPGRVAPQERIVLVAHVQEPGANDDASGCATLVELARALALGIAQGRLAAPDRTITMLWVDEIRGSREWIRAHAGEVRGVRYMFSLDMTGEDTSKTGGTFLVEKAPDPSALWARPSDPHSEWGESEVSSDRVRGTALNDLLLAVCHRLAAREGGWDVRSNPYEGGSDHTVFGDAGVPSILAWHFTDRYYHTNMDRPDKTSPAEMRRVALAIGAAAYLLATASSQDARSLVQLLAAAARERLAIEAAQGESASQATGRAQDQRAIVEAWRRWYSEALQELARLPTEATSTALRDEIARAVAALR